ncbi:MULTISPECIES: YfjI family protein [unclassified Pseudomonas]|uniref:YfjI family protein n=1 Tax=unclassified Pseudomonas TaxID=196821 RepID=UPI00215BBCBD|nr:MULTISPECIES: YfjI family protein [unclassified Pseudomonas]MCR8933204.1 YfjI family protein [Pseudomonas sp. S11A4]MCR8976807.1 YfjI family protein [Pseudomonas sp. S11P7]
MQQLDPTLELPRPPRPLIESNPVAQPYPVQALGGILGPAVERMAEVIGVPQALAAQSVLAASALATQGHAGLQLDGRNYPLSLYLITVAASGDRKTAADRFALLPARQWEREQWQRYREQLARYRAAQRQEQRIKPGDSEPANGMSLEAEPSAPRLITTDPTIEALIKGLCNDMPSMGLFCDEGGQFLGSSTMSRDNRLKAVTTLSSLWDGSPIDRARSMVGESLRAYDRRLSLHLMLQPYLAMQLLSDPLLQGQGILGRCLMTWPTSLAGQRSYQSVDLSKDAALKRYHHRLSALFYQPWSLSPDGALQLSPLTLSPLARRRWIDLHDAIEAQMGEFGELASVRPSGSKAADNLLRVAGILAVVEESSVVEVDHIQRASALVGYYLTEIQRLTEQEPVCRVKEEADRLLRWLQAKDWKRFNIRELNRNGPRFARKSSRHAAKLLVELIDHQWLTTDGHTFEVRHVQS